MPKIVFDEVSKSYGDLVVLKDLSFEVDDQEFFGLVGPSGCGKSTILNILANLVQPDDGTFTLVGDGGASIESRSSYTTGFVFQSPNLLDWKTVRGNLDFAMASAGIAGDERDGVVEEVLDVVGLLDVADRYPQALSGGMKQRVGIARALCIDPDILLMDEPFNSLDEITARELRTELLDIWSGRRKTVLFVTHNIEEAVYLSDRVGVLSSKPTNLIEVVDVDMDRPRDANDVRIAEFRGRILDLLGIE